MNTSMAATIQAQFMAAVKLADDIYETTQDRDSSIGMLRAAFKLCPACPATKQGTNAGQLLTPA